SAPAKGPPPLARPATPSSPPLATPVAPAAVTDVPVAQPVEKAPSALSFTTEPDVLLAPRHQRKTRPRRRIGKLLVFLTIMLFCVGAMAGGGYFIWRSF